MLKDGTNKKAVYGWAMYDWANSAFATTVMAGFFPIFFKEYWSAGVDVNTSTAMLGVGNSIASLAIVLTAPVLGALADQAGAKKKLLIFFSYFGVVLTASLFFIQQGAWALATTVYVLCSIGFSAANVFYDSLLSDVADEKSVDYVSGLGYSFGYLGGGLLFLLNVLMTLYPASFGLTSSAEAVRYSFLTVALWWGGFTIFTISWVTERQSLSFNPTNENLFTNSFKQVFHTIKQIRRHRAAFMFLIAYWLYIDGVDTVIRMAVDYGISIGFKSNDLIAALLLTQFVGFPSAILFGRAASRWHIKRLLYGAIFVYIVVTIWAVFMKSKEEFYLLAVCIGLVQGGVQALSRSYYCRLIPQDQTAEFFGFYNMLGKFAAILGPLLIAAVGLIAKRLLTPPTPAIEQVQAVSHTAARYGIASLIILFVAGGVALYFVDEKKDNL